MAKRYYSSQEMHTLRRLISSVGAMKAKKRKVIAKFIQPTWEAVFSACMLVDHRIPVRELSRVRLWITKEAIDAGPQAVATVLKQYSTIARWVAASINTPADLLADAGPAPAFHPATPVALIRIMKELWSVHDRDKRAELLVQLSYIGRALPPPTPGSDVVAKVLQSHAERLSKVHPEDPVREYSIRRFAMEWAQERKHLVPETSSMSVCTSACVGSTRDQGGLRSALTAMVDRWFDEPSDSYDDLRHWPSFKDPTRFTDEGERGRMNYTGVAPRGSTEYVCNILEDPDAERRRVARILRDCSLRWADGVDVPEAEVLAVEERGFKARVVTKSPPECVELGHLVRGLVWPMLEADDRVRVSLEGGRLETFFEHLRDHPFLVPTDFGDLALISADLSAATDSFAPWAINAVWDGVCDGAGLPPDIRKLGRLLLGPMKVRYPEESGIQPFTSTAGCLMGLPLSWFVLNLINLWACENAVSNSSRILRFPGRVRERLVRVAVCGDDLAAILPRAAHRSYRDNLEAVGSGFSAGKHLVSRHILLFTEQVAIFHQVTCPAPAWMALASVPQVQATHLHPKLMLDVMPVRAIVHPGHFAVKRVSGPLRFEQPSWATAGPAITSSIPAWGSLRLRRTVSILAAILRPERRRLLDAGIAVELPREVGGGGFPPRRPERSFGDSPGTWRRFLLACFVYKEAEPIRRARNLWLSTGVAGDVLDEALSIAQERLPSLIVAEATDLFEHPRDSYEVTVSQGVCMPEADCLLKVAATWAPALSVGGFFTPRGYTMKFWKFAKRLRAIIRDQSHRITGRGGLLSGRTDSEILESVRDLADGKVYILDREDIPPSLSVELGTRPGNPGRWASPRVRPIRSRSHAQPKGRTVDFVQSRLDAKFLELCDQLAMDDGPTGFTEGD